MPATVSVSLSSSVLPTLSLTTDEDTYAFTESAQVPAQPVIVQFACTQAWLMGTTPGGPYFRIPADAPFNYHVWPGLTLYVKADTTSATLRGIRVQ
jgi:hypothetical protein